MSVRRHGRLPDRDLRRLLTGLRNGRDDAFAAFYALAHAAARAISDRYRHPAYRLEGSADDVGQQFVLHLVDRRASRGNDYLADIAAAATSMQHLERVLEQRARRWAIDRSRGELPDRLRRRIVGLPDRDAARFAWVVRLRYLARTGGSRVVRELLRDRVAARLERTPAGRAVIEDYRRRVWIGPNQLADGVYATLLDVDGAAAPGPLADVLLLICGQADTRPAILFKDAAWWERIPDDTDDDLGEEAFA